MMSVFMVTTSTTTTLFQTRELAEQSIKLTRDALVGGGYIGNLHYTLDEIVVHNHPRMVRE